MENVGYETTLLVYSNKATSSTSRSPLRKDSISTDGATRTSHAKRHRNTMHKNKSSVMLRAVVLHMQFITNLYVVFAHCSSVYSKLRMNSRILISPSFSSYRMHRNNTNLTKIRKQEKLIGSMWRMPSARGDVTVLPQRRQRYWRQELKPWTLEISLVFTRKHQSIMERVVGAAQH